MMKKMPCQNGWRVLLSIGFGLWFFLIGLAFKKRLLSALCGLCLMVQYQGSVCLSQSGKEKIAYADTKYKYRDLRDDIDNDIQV